MTMHTAYPIVLGGGALAALLSWCYFRRYAVSRPPVGVFNMPDVAILLTAIVLVPYAYLHLPLGVVVVLLALTVSSVLWFTLEPVLRRRWLVAAAVVCAVAADVVLVMAQGALSNGFLAVNGVLMIVAVVGVANLWVQSGMGAREVTVLGAALAVYDFIATSQLTLMTDLIGRLSEIPFVPFLAWDAHGAGLGVGLGDLLLISAFPLAMRKSFGHEAGRFAFAAGIAVLAAVLAIIDLGIITTAIPVMVVLGPLMVAQFAFWSRRAPQRTTLEYLQAEPQLPAAARA
jgi:hypothetical protein